MTVETAVAELITATTALLVAVDVQKITLDTAVGTAMSQAAIAKAAADAVGTSLGYQIPVAYAAGLSITLANQVVSFVGPDGKSNSYAPVSPAVLPFTTSGTFEATKFRLVAGVIASDLAAPGAANVIGTTPQAGPPRSVQQQLDMLYFGIANVWDVQFAGGADTTGLTDSSAAIQAALASKKFVNFGSFDYLLAAPLVPKTGQTLLFSSATFKTATRTQSAFYCNGINGFSFLGQLNVIGTVTGTPAFAADGGHGIIVRDCYNWLIENPCVSWFSGNGLFITISDPSYQTGPNVSLGQVLHGNFQKNGYGVQTSGGFMAEYVTFTGTFAEYNANAGYIGYAGNVMWHGGSISHNYLSGVEIRSSFNSAHGAFIGVMINHNIQAAIVALNVVNGQLFNGCTIFDNNGGPRVGAIFLTESTGVTFNGCEIYADFVVTNASKDKINVLNGSVFASGGGAPGRQYHVYSDDASDFTLVVLNSYQAGTLGNGVPNQALSMSDCQMTAAIDQTLTVGAETRVTWNAFVSRHGFNMFDGALKNFKVVVPGIYRINYYLVFNSLNSTMPTGMYCNIKINGVAKRYQIIPNYSATDAWLNFPVTITLAKDDVVDLSVFLPSGSVQLKPSSEISISLG